MKLHHSCNRFQHRHALQPRDDHPVLGVVFMCCEVETTLHDGAFGGLAHKGQGAVHINGVAVRKLSSPTRADHHFFPVRFYLVQTIAEKHHHYWLIKIRDYDE